MALGTDISGSVDLDPALREVTGQRALAEAIVRRLTTTLGALQDHPAYGFNIAALIGTTLSDDAIRQKVLAQVFDEEEIEDADLSIVRDGSGGISLALSLESGEGPFEFTISVSAVGVSAIIPVSN